MTRFRIAPPTILTFVMVAVVAVHRGRATAARPTEAAPARSFEFTYQVHVPAIADPGGPTHLWIPLPQADGGIAGYHCWAEFYLAGVGWVPVDASEAWKNPAKRDFFFGRTTSIAFSLPTVAISGSRQTRRANR